ncbi:MAG: pyruvate, phosphate dikinase [Gemmatimonadetes bacterium]|nr:pyruvate, phosphate dikinase [Gemmatimonadota bacterium]
MQHVFFFGDGRADGSARMKDILGGKGANLHEMTRLGIPVPPGFTISAKLCTKYLTERKLPEELCNEVTKAMLRLESVTGRSFGDTKAPLLVSVRSGAKFSMPGMMNTVLNLGLNDATVAALAEQTGNPGFAYDSYRRFVQMYAVVVLNLKPEDGAHPIEDAIEQLKSRRNAKREIDLDPSDLQELVITIKSLVERETGLPFPDDPWDQLWRAIEAVFRSWHTKRAIDYRRLNDIPGDLGTAVNVMTMVYGNMGEDSATGVVFTRNPSTGEPKLFGEFLVNAQGEDVVAGIRTPEPIDAMAAKFPKPYDQLGKTCDALERHYRDMQDVEFTVERGHLYLLQTRSAKRTAQAAIRAAVDMVHDSLITEQEAVSRVDPYQLDQLLHQTIDPSAPVDVLSTGLPASPGAAVGRVVFDADRAVERTENGDPVILVRRETNPDDFHGMVAAAGILTERGGMTSHAAVVARGMGKSCVSGCKGIHVDEQNRLFVVDHREVKEGDWLTIDGSGGRVIAGRVTLIDPTPSEQFEQLMEWADKFRRLRVRTNADTSADSHRAIQFGAEGIGLCRTEHMFFEENRIDAMREMIVAKDLAGRRKALAKLLPMQRSDFLGIFQAMDGYPVTIRLLDPPLHEFLPQGTEEIKKIAKRINVPFEQLRNFVEMLTEVNPMLGHRGCRLGITYPEITEMQAEAIFEAACDALNEGVQVFPEVMVPLVAYAEEFRRQSDLVRKMAERVFARRKVRIDYLVGTMIELPRAALTANEIAETAQFFSFGTNDLTQTTLGLSRDDAGRFLPAYIDSGIVPQDPFQTIDRDGVGALVEMGVERGRSTSPALKIGICGEHGGDPKTIKFCHDVGMNYVSCSPFRIPIARLAAAQAALSSEETVDTR